MHVNVSTHESRVKSVGQKGNKSLSMARAMRWQWQRKKTQNRRAETAGPSVGNPSLSPTSVSLEHIIGIEPHYQTLSLIKLALALI